MKKLIPMQKTGIPIIPLLIGIIILFIGFTIIRKSKVQLNF